MRLAPILSRWERLTRQPIRACRRIARDEVWTTWCKEVLPGRKALRTLPSLPVPSLEKETAPSEPESGSSDDESHDVNHADNRLASAQRSCLEAGVKHVSTPTIKGGSKKPRKLAEISPKRAPLAL